MFVAAFLSIVGLGVIAWLLITLTVYALPTAAGFMAGMLAYRTGAGLLGAGMVALVAGALTLGLGQRIFAMTRSPVLRAVLAGLYAERAAFAAYHAVLAITGMSSPSETWRQVFAILGATAIGAIAWNRVGRSVHS